MQQTYQITGMSCQGCREHVTKALAGVQGVAGVTVDLEKGEAVLQEDAPVPLEKLQEALQGTIYRIAPPGQLPATPEARVPPPPGSGVFYCPMQCEGDKTYPGPGHCPVCGMDLVEQPALQTAVQYTCPMHPEIISDHPGSCPICGMDLVPAAGKPGAEDKTFRDLARKFRIAVLFTVPVFVLSMSGMIPGRPLEHLMPAKGLQLLEMLFSVPVVFYATWTFFQRGWQSVKNRHLNMFTLVAMGAGAAWLYSVAALAFGGFFPEGFRTSNGTVPVYFEAATVILTLVLLGQLLEARAHGKTKYAINALLKLAPHTATLAGDDGDRSVPIAAIRPGDLLRVRAGEKVPVDGTITAGTAVLDESMLTGEPMPVDKKEGDVVSAGTLNGSGAFVMRAERVGSETLLSRIIEMVNAASRSRAPVQDLADRISAYFVPAVAAAAAITFVAWAVWGPEPSYVHALVNAVAVLIIACPCALGLATPMAVMAGIGRGAQAGILVRNAAALQKISAADVVVVDKTGTLTEGRPSVEKVVSTGSAHTEDDLLVKAVSLNSGSNHPLAAALRRYAEERKLPSVPVTGFQTVSGMGVTGMAGGSRLALGNARLMEEEGAALPAPLMGEASREREGGGTLSWLAENGRVTGYIVMGDPVKTSAAAAIGKLHREGLEVIMFTGDHEQTAAAVAGALGLDGYKASMLPQDKAAEIKKLQQAGKKVAMAGDGINDAPALAQADIGIAMGTGTDVAIESAGITLVKGDLNGISAARNLGAKVMRNIRENLFFALGYNVLGIPIAAGVLYPFAGILLSPMIAALAMSFSSVSVIANSLRLRRAAL
jgi:Cu2+-exporting ATPase